MASTILLSAMSGLDVSGRASADELILDHDSAAVKRGGDFTLSVSSDAFFQRDVFYLADLEAEDVEVSAGELWSHFKAHGVDSLDRLILFVDVDPDCLANGPIELDNLQLIIEDPDHPGRILTQASLDRDDPSNRIVWKQTAGQRSVARVELDLGYDFMRRFSSGSQQKLVLHLTAADGAIPITAVGISGEREVSLTSKMLMLFLFIAFWAGVFAIMYRMTVPQTPTGSLDEGLSVSQPEIADRNAASLAQQEAVPAREQNGKKNGHDVATGLPTNGVASAPIGHHDVRSEVK